MTDKVFPVYTNAEKEVGASLERADGSFAEAKLYDMLRKQLPQQLPWQPLSLLLQVFSFRKRVW